MKVPNVQPEHKLYLAQALMENGKYSEAKTWFQEYELLNSTDNMVKRMIMACDSIDLFFQDTTIYEISLLKLNKENESNFSPAFYREGIVFLSDRTAPGKNRERSVWTGREYLDLFYSKRLDAEQWMEPDRLKGNINGLYDEGPAVFKKDNTTIYFTRNDYSGKVIEKNEKNINVLKMYYGELVNNQWRLMGEMPFNGVDYSVGHPALSQDGNTIFFVSDMPWGYGGTDLYSVTWSDGKWGEPENLGPRVNSEGNEMFPFLSADSLLYFASDGHIGLGGLDVYVSYPEPDKKWSRPENLQHPLNSSKDDFGFIIDSTNTYGYFSSNRFKNTDKLFGFKKNPPVFTLDLKVFDKKSLKPVKRAGLYHAFSGGRGSKVSESGSNEISVKLNPRTSYHMLVISDGYYAKEIKYSTIGKKKSETFADSVLLTKIELNKSIRWPSITFKGKESNITPSTAIVLDSLYAILMNNPTLQIEILTHTDSKGADADNLALSRKRSDEIAFYLINKGISAPRLISLGYGESYLLNNCRDGILCLEEDHAVNNRTEIRVTGYIKPDTGMIK